MSNNREKNQSLRKSSSMKKIDAIGLKDALIRFRKYILGLKTLELGYKYLENLERNFLFKKSSLFPYLWLPTTEVVLSWS